MRLWPIDYDVWALTLLGVLCGHSPARSYADALTLTKLYDVTDTDARIRVLVRSKSTDKSEVVLELTTPDHREAAFLTAQWLTERVLSGLAKTPTLPPSLS